MLKPLKKQSRAKILFKIKLKKFIRYQLWQHVIVVAFVVFCAWFFNKLIEAVMFCVAHCVIRPRFDKQGHFSATSWCLATTLTIVWFGVSYILPVSISLLSSIPVCFFISYAGFLVQDRLDVYKELSKIRKQIEEQEFDVDTCTEEEMISRCRELRFSEDKIRIAIEMFIKKTKQSKLAEMLCVEEKSIQQQKRRLRKKLNNK